MKRLVTLFLCTMTFACFGQKKNLCTFSSSAAPYRELRGDIPLTDSLFKSDSVNSVLVDINNESFPLYGEPWNFSNEASLFVTRQGRLEIKRANDFTVLDGLYAHLYETIDKKSKVSWKIEGSRGNRIIKVQWKHLRITTGPEDNFINLQTWIYQKSGIVEFHYGPRSENNASGYSVYKDSPFIGIWLSDYKYKEIREKMNLFGLPGDYKLNSNLDMRVPPVNGVPAEGTVHRFTPARG